MMKKIKVLLLITLLTAAVFLPGVTSQKAINKHSNENTKVEFVGEKCGFSGKGSNLDNLATTPSIDLSDITSAILEINTEIEILPVGNGDYGYIKISKNGGSDWTILKDKIQGYTPDWVTWKIPLENWSYPNIIIGFEFITESDSISDGWFINKIEVKGDHTVIYTENFSKYNAGDPWGEWTVTVQLQPPNAPPNTPTIIGPAYGKPGINLIYNFASVDLDNNNVYYYIDWGDGTNTDWIGPKASGEILTSNHNWSEKGDYNIKAKAKDTHGEESKWGSLKIKVPVSQSQSQSSSQQSPKSLNLKTLFKNLISFQVLAKLLNLWKSSSYFLSFFTLINNFYCH
jgi:hypothetical protein